MILLNKLILLQVVSHPPEGWPELELMVETEVPRKHGGTEKLIKPGFETGTLSLPFHSVWTKEVTKPAEIQGGSGTDSEP